MKALKRRGFIDHGFTLLCRFRGGRGFGDFVAFGLRRWRAWWAGVIVPLTISI